MSLFLLLLFIQWQLPHRHLRIKLPKRWQQQKHPKKRRQTKAREAAPSATPEEEEDTQAPPLQDAPQAIEELTYANTQASNAVCIAKQLLKDGDLDAALETIGKEMSRVSSLIGNEEQASIHECMAPLYYLYGTTLLYTIEESTDVAAAMNTTTTEEEEDVDDLQIAWENLDTARHLVSRMVQDTTTFSTPSQKELTLDLAQIHLRLGDLLKANGSAHVEAIQEYQSSLEIRQAVFGLYHKQVSQVVFALAQTYMLLASEGDKENSEIQQTPAQVTEHCIQAIQHYVECAKSFAGQIATLCGMSPNDVVTVDTATLQNGGGTKTTGMYPAELEISVASQVIQAIRQRVKSLTANNTSDAEQVYEWKQVLDEIQETIDEVENAKLGIQKVSHMKVKAKEAVSANDSVEMNANGSTTTIGFGNATTSNVAVATTASTSDTAKPMMVIKKKKKRDADAQEESEDKKLVAQGTPSEQRPSRSSRIRYRN